MKRATREWVERTKRLNGTRYLLGTLALSDIIASDAKKDAVIRDLKARLAAVEPHIELLCPRWSYLCRCKECRARNATNLKNKDWRTP